MTPTKFVSSTFSPSHFLNSPQISFDHLTSTPVFGLNPQSQSTPMQSSYCLNSSSHSLNTPTNVPVSSSGSRSGQLQTPKSRRTLIQPTPKTPTPLKNALRELEEKNGPLKPMVNIFCDLILYCLKSIIQLLY